MKKGIILVTGGAGFIGSVVNLMLLEAGYETIIYDNLSTGNAHAVAGGVLIQGDLDDKNKLDEVFSHYPIQAVLHFAASTDVGESVANPSLYYANNFVNSLNLMDAMVKHGVRSLIFSSTAAVYGMPDLPLIIEDIPCHPINPYGMSKWMTEQALKDYAEAYGLKSVSLRYFNAAGADSTGRIRSYKKKENNLIPIVINAILRKTPVTIFGTDYPTPDGTCVRDYIHVDDLGRAHLLALEKLLTGNASPCYNLGNGEGYTVREVLEAAERVTGHPIEVIEGPRRPGDPALLLADASRAERELGWIPEHPNIDEMVKDAWKARTV
jgi:UDP-glucose 4-epimerase